MGSLLVDLLPSAIGLAVAPAAIATVILLLGSRSPLPNAVAFAAPFALVYGALSAIMLTASAAADEPLVSDRTKHVTGLVVGLLLLALALGTWLRSRRPRLRRGESRLLTALAAARPSSSFGIGVAVSVLNPNLAILLGGLATIAAADVTLAGQLTGAALLVVGAELAIGGAILWYVARRDDAERGLLRAKEWFRLHEGHVNIAVLAVFGLAFTAKGLAGLA